MRVCTAASALTTIERFQALETAMQFRLSFEESDQPEEDHQAVVLTRIIAVDVKDWPAAGAMTIFLGSETAADTLPGVCDISNSARASRAARAR